MKYFPNNLTVLIKRSGLTRAAIVRKLGYASQSRLSNYERGHSKPRNEDILAIAKFFNVSVENLTAVDLGDHVVKELEDSVRNISHTGNMPNCYYVPIKAFGGFLGGYDKAYYMDGLEKFYVPFITGECYCFEVDGFSMADEYLPSDKVYCTLLNGPEELMKGKDYIFQTIDGIILKKFDKIDDNNLHLRSINPDPRYKVKPIPLKNVKRIYFIEEHLRKPNKK